MNSTTPQKKIELFLIPSVVFVTIVLSLILRVLGITGHIGTIVLLAGIFLGCLQLIRDTITSLINKSFALDYIAILAITTGLVTGNFFVAAVIVLMMSGGNTLETYAKELAKSSLTALSERIPYSVIMLDNNQEKTLPIEKVPLNCTILVRKGEVIPLDGLLQSDRALIDESSLTGEAYSVEKKNGDRLYSGTINIGEALHFKNTVKDENSTYRNIIKLVEKAQTEKTPFLQLADQLSIGFTAVTIGLAALAFFISQDINRVLAVLVVATPCPLILATPIALIGGMNTAAREHIIFRRLASLEILSSVSVMIFDKTGTITFGTPNVTAVNIFDTVFSKESILSLASGLEKNSLHPFAQAIIKYAQEAHVSPHHFVKTTEEIGKGISGETNGYLYHLYKGETSQKVTLFQNEKALAHFEFSDVLKPDFMETLVNLQKDGIEMALFTGDSNERTQQIAQDLPKNIDIRTDLKPEDKLRGIEQYKQKNAHVAMIGDGINDAPALAKADVGIAFSHDEHTAASEAADVVLLGSNFKTVLDARTISRRTLHIAKQSMYVGLGLSLFGMFLAVIGKLPPLFGAVAQEITDVAVILNALRAAFPQKRS